MRVLMACLCRRATLGHRCQDVWFTVHGGLLSTILNVILQVNRSIGEVLWVLMDSNAGGTVLFLEPLLGP
jgi:hypothetical protein